MSQPSQSDGPTTLARLAEMFRVAMGGLEQTVDAADLEKWSVVIHSSLSGRGRSDHTVEHVFTVKNEGNGLLQIARTTAG